MITEISTILLSEDKRKMLLAVDIILWISLVFVTFDDWVAPLMTIPLKEIDEMYRFILSASYVNFVQWAVIIVSAYFLIKFLLIIVIPRSHAVFNFYQFKVLDESVQISISDIQFKGNRARPYHKRKARHYRATLNLELNHDIVRYSKLSLGILLKLIILGFVKMGSPEAPLFWVAVVSILIAFTVIVIIEISLISASAQNRLSALISRLS